MSLVPSNEFPLPGELVNVDVYVDAAADLGGYQLAIDITGGTAGNLPLESMMVDTMRTNYAFYGVSSIEAVSDYYGQIGAANMTDTGVAVTAPAYLGTFQLRASANAVGVFHIAFAAPDENFLMDSAARALPDTITGDGIYIGVNVECTVDAHCDDAQDCTDDTCNNGTCINVVDDTNSCTDGNDCTADACTAGACVSTNAPAGTPCDDGLFCTATDTCDGAGACIGSTISPCPPDYTCNENMDRCTRLLKDVQR